jgi:hypothetical protein
MKNQRCQPLAPARNGERGAGVVGADQVEERRDRAHVVELEAARDQRLGDLVEQHHRDRDREPDPERRSGGARPSGDAARLAGAVQVRDAAAADRRMRTVAADVAPVVPAALALGGFADRGANLERGVVGAGERFGLRPPT